MSSLTKTPAQESASADSTTSVPAQASISTTESTLSVDEYHALQYKKRVEDKAAAPESILEGSSVFHTDGSMPTDYGSDINDVSMEDGEVPSLAADSKSAAVAHNPVTGSRRPREDDRARVMTKKRRHQRRLRLLLRVLSRQNALRGCQAHPRLLPGSVRLRHRTRSRCTCAAPSLMTLRLLRSSLIR
ncbi:hypothetical protein PC116_g29944 [Phytophthora cactorum]|uniref:Uncharacterized protein n=1 Tax=Phytophthora cactorum TaxID=29920 RepID=A0A8T1JDS4_9STRA|nr:hypothetical protein Pcac1_g25163 [Phytophthora cactorum]KAG2763121.1 hypothetical protein Pcac1_g25162 [Phytophthora cactorum]KAG2781217.1 hypothetical protein PC111_g24549 [Phytophthora cactorum]KAG2795789.1 hypothetical protein PC112_g22490 [Phytophthora cactorum]KAG2802122.1 hypothetical protein PC113_g24524 [Phytophthora cactorum]